MGRISKKWSGFAREAFTDADNFGISFPMDLDVKMKAVLIGACMLIVSIEFVWQESQSIESFNRSPIRRTVGINILNRLRLLGFAIWFAIFFNLIPNFCLSVPGYDVLRKQWQISGIAITFEDTFPVENAAEFIKSTNKIIRVKFQCETSNQKCSIKWFKTINIRHEPKEPELMGPQNISLFFSL